MTLRNYRGVGKLEIGPLGDRVVVVGPNGSGKSTFASALLNGHKSGLADVDRPAAFDREVVGPDNWEWECILDIALSAGQDIWDAICDRRVRDYLIVYKVAGNEGSVARMHAAHAWRAHLEDILYALCRSKCGKDGYYGPVVKAFGDNPTPDQVKERVRKLRVTISHTGANDPARSTFDFLDDAGEVVIPREVLHDLFSDVEGPYIEYVAAAVCFAWIGGIMTDGGASHVWLDRTRGILRPDATNLKSVLRWSQIHDPDRVAYIKERFRGITGHTIEFRTDYWTSVMEARVDSGEWQLLDSLASGHLQIIAILAAKASSLPDRLCIIDEPERNLHPDIARRLSDILFESNGGQMLVFTHSPIFVNPARADTVLRFAHAPGSARIEVTTLEETRLFEVLDCLGARGSDIFLYNRILWVEGPSDEIYLRHWIRHFGPPDLREVGELGVISLPAGPWGAANLVPDVLKRLCRAHGILLDGDDTGKAALEKAVNVLVNAGAESTTWKVKTIEQLLPAAAVSAALEITPEEAAGALSSPNPVGALKALPRHSQLTKVELAHLLCREEHVEAFSAHTEFRTELDRVLQTLFPKAAQATAGTT